MEKHTSYRTYWVAWALLLVLTVIMLLTEAFRLPAIVTVLVLIGAMMVKATVIGGWFMHLRYEHKGLVAAVVLGTLATAAALFLLLAPDGISMYHLAQ
jgi:caa(3)-type oxidase subunit IV